MKLNRLEKQIAAGIYATREALRVEEILCVVHSQPDATHRRDVSDAKENGCVRIALSDWIGHDPTPAESVKACRSYARLERAGLVERVNFFGGNRTTHLRLTRKGVAIATELLTREKE
jgi:hypothetical protein